MNNTGIKSWKKQTFRLYVLEEDDSLTWFSLLLLGVLAALLHQHLRVGLNVPGHHGLEWLTLLLFGRMQSRYRWAGIIIAAGAVSTCMVQAVSLPFAHTSTTAMFYLLNGVCVDILFRVVPPHLPVIIRGVIFGGTVFMIKPVALIAAAIFFDAETGSIEKYGYLVPVLTHIMFGSIGAITGITLAGLAGSQSRKSPP